MPRWSLLHLRSLTAGRDVGVVGPGAGTLVEARYTCFLVGPQCQGNITQVVLDGRRGQP